MIINNSGGGAPLNFKVVGGTTEPANPKENTIWVNTATEITGWVFSAEQPKSPVAGMVWIDVGVSSPASMNVLKKNTIMVYPNSVKQYVGSAWVDKTSSTFFYTDGWVSINRVLFNAASASAQDAKHFVVSNSIQTVSLTSSYVLIKQKDSGGVGTCYTTDWYENLDLTPYKTLRVVLQTISVGSTTSERVAIVPGTTSTSTTSPSIVASTEGGTSKVQKTIDISGLQGEYKIAFITRHPNRTIYLYELELLA